MKFTNLQQKWALTTGLMIALGFSLSTHFSPKSGPEYAQLGASQEQIEPVMLAQNKELHVTHMSAQLPPPSDVKKEETKTEARVFKVDRDGEEQKVLVTPSGGKANVSVPTCKVIRSKKCPTGNCTDETALLDVDFNSNISELVNAFNANGISKCASSETEKTTAAASTTSATNAEVKPSAPTTATATTEVSEEDKHKAVFDKLRAKCDKESKESRLNCNIDGLTKLLTDSKVVYTKAIVVDFFKTQIEEPMKNALGSYDYNNPFAQHEYIEKTRELSSKIKEMQEEIGSSYSYLRERIANMSVRAIAEKALEVNTYRHTGQIGFEGAALNQLQIMNQLLPASNRMGLMAAMSNSAVNLNPLYASNMYSSVGSLGNNVLSNIARIADMDPYNAQALLGTGLMGLDGWNYQRGALRSLDLVPQFQRLGLDGDTLLLSDRFSGRGRRGAIYDRGGLFGSADYLTSRSGRRLSRRGTMGLNRSTFFQDSSSVYLGNRLGLNTDGLLGQPQVYRTGVSQFGNTFLPASDRVILNGSRGLRGSRF